ncbi:60S ribosomal protein L21-1-like protein [Carex littledalei]|uniref:60S ribosomal protein L21-1-like protein n=1 Tax=Carex littledalei TaxID=544730 RepID=A0A833V545_9POAL|nr:60S ribosomal protein L21-1-like protein [Carex littledalei]
MLSTRSLSRPFRKKGYIALTTYLRTAHTRSATMSKCRVNGAVHKGMLHKFYHCRTGRVWNVTKRAIGVEINKQNCQERQDQVSGSKHYL